MTVASKLGVARKTLCMEVVKVGRVGRKEKDGLCNNPGPYTPNEDERRPGCYVYRGGPQVEDVVEKPSRTGYTCSRYTPQSLDTLSGLVGMSDEEVVCIDLGE